MKSARDAKTDGMKMEKGKPSFKEKNDIGPVPDGAKAKPALQKDMFGPDALGSEIATTPMYAKKTTNTLDKGVFAHKDNMISPDANY